eukprot:2078153-Prorocentrum_lima.AAC.1
MGDWNARLQTRRPEEEPYLGTHFFDSAHVTLHHQADCTADNRERFINFCVRGDLRVMNTFFAKSDRALLTYREKGVGYDPPWTRGRYETLDYVLVPHRWRNMVKDVAADFTAE